MSEQIGVIKSLKSETVNGKEGKTYSKVTINLAFTTGSGQYTKDQVAPFVFFGKNADKTDHFSEGQEVKITYTLGGREYNDKCYPQLDAYEIASVGQAAAAPQQNAPARTAQPASNEPPSDELPF